MNRRPRALRKIFAANGAIGSSTRHSSLFLKFRRPKNRLQFYFRIYIYIYMALPAQHIQFYMRGASDGWSPEVHAIIGSIVKDAKTNCQDQIPKEFATEALINADCIVVSKDTVGGGPGSVRGFAALELHRYDDNEFDGGFSHAGDATPKNRRNPQANFKNYIYIDLICSALRPGVNTKAMTEGDHEIASGKEMLRLIQKYAVQHGFKYIKLKALEHVISYYYRYGWRFISMCGAKENSKIPSLVQQLHAAYKVIMKHSSPGNPDPSPEEQAQIRAILAQFQGHLKGLYGETEQKAAKYNDDEGEGSHQQHVVGLQDQGYTMLWCPGTPGSLVGGRKRRKKTKKTKKTKKKALKKRHRRRKTCRHRCKHRHRRKTRRARRHRRRHSRRRH